jgi:beta-galactosidase
MVGFRPMKILRYPAFLAGLVLAAVVGVRADTGRERISLDPGWRFAKGEQTSWGGALSYTALRAHFLATRDAFLGRAPAAATGEAEPTAFYAAPDFDDHSWRSVDLPHDWAIEGPFDAHGAGETARLPYAGVGWYRRHIAVPNADAGRRFYLQIDGAMAYASVWLNGRWVGGWPYGYASFELDLTAFLKVGADNVLAIRLDNPPDSSRWYPGGGIYRHVWLVKTAQVHVAHWGTFVATPQVSAAAALVTVHVAVTNDAPEPVLAQVHTDIYALGPDGRPAGPILASSPFAVVLVTGKHTLPTDQAILLANPRVWSVRAPNRYVAVTSVERSGWIFDRYETPFGVRTIRYDPDRGFLLNGEALKLQGVCDHHDLGALGAALNGDALERQLRELREMGCNAIRTSHNPPAPELLDLCDRLGFVVLDEAFDCWQTGKRPNDYHLIFNDWHQADLEALIRRDRNHPSVVMWSIGNEIPDQVTPAGPKLARELVGIVHAEDPTRPATSAGDQVASATNGFGDALDLYGYNYKPWLYASYRRDHPRKFVFATESASTISSRGVYVFPVSPDKLAGQAPGWQMSSYDLYAPTWATTPDREFQGQDDTPGVGGEFVWTGWDYLGEPTPYGQAGDPARSSYFGIIDLAGFPKDRYYLYQARWRPDLPMVHLLPHWTWPGRVGQVTPVFAYTSGDEAELFLNGRSLGRRHRGPDEYRLRWDDVVYQPGELKVVAYKGGAPWAEATERTAGAPAAIRLAADRPALRSDGEALAFITASVVDADGTLCPDADAPIAFRVSGPARIVATDNGDATSLAPFQATTRAAFHGLALAIVRAEAGGGGPITVTAEAPGLAAGQVQVASGPPAP